MGNEDKLEVEVAYARPDTQLILSVVGNQGMTLEQAVEQSGILKRFPEIEWDKVKTGIFGKAAKKDAVLHQGDRVEIYRPLIADPKEMRKKRAAEGKKMRRGGGDVEKDGENSEKKP